MAQTVTINPNGLDAFSNHRTAEPSFVADGQLTYDLQPILYEQITSGDGTVTHDATNRCARLRINTATGAGDKAYMQSYQYYRYQAGRAQEVFITFCFNDNEGVEGIRKSVQYGDDSNGVGFELNGKLKRFFIKSDSSTGDQAIEQKDWNLDRLDGFGGSGIKLDTSKTHIFVCDVQALYVGRVRMGFDIDGQIIWAHEFECANKLAYPYIQTANLPIRAGIESSAATTTDDDMLFICSCVLSRGGQEQIAGYDFSVAAAVTAQNGARTHAISIRPRATFNSITNRVEFVLEDLDLIVTGTQPVYWELCLGQALTTPVYADVNTTYSAFETVTGATLSGSPAVVTNSGYCAASASSKLSIERKLKNRYPVTLDSAGSPRDMGTLTLLVTGLGADSACRAVLHFRELR